MLNIKSGREPLKSKLFELETEFASVIIINFSNNTFIIIELNRAAFQINRNFVVKFTK